MEPRSRPAPLILPATRRPRRSRLLGALLLLLSASLPGRAENRIEGLSVGSGGGIGGSLTPDLIELDVASKGAVGFRQTELGDRDTHEVYLRWLQREDVSPVDPRDKRSASKGTLAERQGIHLGLSGIEVDGTRGGSQSLRMGIFKYQRLNEALMGIAEFDYQTGTFGGDAAGRQNKGGVAGRLGTRYKISDSFYAIGEFSTSPGAGSSLSPQIRVGASF